MDATKYHESIVVLRERQKWMRARIEAKKSIGWQTQWDQRELDALEWACHTLTSLWFDQQQQATSGN